MRIRTGVEHTFWVIGIGCLAWGVWSYSHSFLQKREGERQFKELATSTPISVHPGVVLGRLALQDGTRAVVFEGTEVDQLSGGIGHVSGTALALDSGNIALAAHRDTFFKSLREVEAGDHLVLETADGEAAYRVVWTAVVPPQAVDVLRPTPAPSLTLITCYPFDFFGQAPERFIVRAVQVSRKSNANLSSR